MSPLKQLVLTWWGKPKPPGSRVPVLRAQLYAAAAEEIIFHAAYDLNTDPKADPVFQWADQWIDVANMLRVRIDIGIRDMAEFNLGLSTPPVTHMHAAANDT